MCQHLAALGVVERIRANEDVVGQPGGSEAVVQCPAVITTVGAISGRYTPAGPGCAREQIADVSGHIPAGELMPPMTGGAPAPRR